MPTLKEDIITMSDWIVAGCSADGVKLDYSMESLKEIDKFIDTHSENGKAKPGGRLSNQLGSVLFALGSYVGQTLIKNIPNSEWETDDNDPKGEINIAVKLGNNSIVWPVQRVTKRFQNGSEDSVYDYGQVLIQSKRSNEDDEDTQTKKKPWWKL